MAVDDVALGHEVPAPDRVEDMPSRHDLPAATRQQVEQALLDSGEIDLRAAGSDEAIHDVDLDLSERDRGDDREIDAQRPSGDRDGAREQPFGREWRRQNVIDAEIECPKLRLEVATPGEPKDRRPASLHRVGGPDQLEQRAAVVMVHVDHAHVGGPFGQDRRRLGEVAGSPYGEHPVVERQRDEVHDHLAIV